MKIQNLDQEETWQPKSQLLDIGTHTCWIDEAEEGETSNGNPQIELKFREINNTGEIRDWLVVTENSKGKLKALLEAASVPIEGGEWEPPIHKLVGSKVRITVIEEDSYKNPGQKRRVVGGYEAPLPGSDENGAKADDDLPF